MRGKSIVYNYEFQILLLEYDESGEFRGGILMKPLIGITCNYDYHDNIGLTSKVGTAGQDWNYVAGDYVYAVEKAGGIPIVLPVYEDFENLRTVLDKLDGVIMSGGHDVGPEQYGQGNKACGMITPQRDCQELEMVRYLANHTDKPVLGICRGIQIINVAMGGTLYQDLQTEGFFLNHSGFAYPRNHAWHDVLLQDDSALAAIFDKTRLQVNSYHHQAVLSPGESVRITARASDGVIEGLEIPDKPFFIAVQWHPEMMYDSEEQLKLLKAFVDACR